MIDAEHTHPATGHRYSAFETSWIPGVIIGSSVQWGVIPYGGSLWAVDPSTGVTIRIGFFDDEHTGPTGWRRTDDYFSHTAVIPDLVFGISERFVDEEPAGLSLWKFRQSDLRQERIGFTDASHTNAETGERTGGFSGYNRRGDMMGHSRRFHGNSQAGQSAWYIPGGSFTAVRIGLADALHTSPVGTPFQFSIPMALNEAGSCAGVSTLYHTAALPPGQSAWVHSPLSGQTVRTGLVDADHVDTSGYHFSDVLAIDEAGGVCGTTARIIGGQFRGDSAWVYHAATGLTLEVGLSTPEHISLTGARVSRPTLMFPDGVVAGFASRFSGANYRGQSAWVYRPATSTSTLVGLTDAAHTDSDGTRWSEVVAQMPDGRIIGWSSKANSHSQSLWLWNPATGSYGLIGLTSPHSDHQFVKTTESGTVLGYSRLTTSSQQVTWMHDPTTGLTTTLGLYDDEHQIGLGNEFEVPNPVGRYVQGKARRRTDLGGGFTPWVADLETGLTHRIGLTDEMHTSGTGFRQTRAHFAAGGEKLYGYSTRMNGSLTLGQTLFVVDLATFTHSTLLFSVRNDGFAYSDAFSMDAEGVLWGTYNEYSTSSAGVRRSFMWSAAEGMHHLDTVIAGGFESAGYATEGGISMFTSTGGICYGRAVQQGQSGNLNFVLLPRRYCEADFNGDGDSGTDADIEAFFACLAGNCCATCVTADFNGDGEYATDGDIESFFRVLSDGEC